MNKRIERLRETIRPRIYPICTDKGRLITESYATTDRQPEVIRNAKAIAHILDHIPIFIEDGELLVGNPASKPGGIEFTDLYGLWTEAEIDSIKTDEGLSLSEKDEAELRRMNIYWKGKTFNARLTQLFNEETLGPYMHLGVVLPPWEKGMENWGGGLAGNGLGVRIEHGSIGVAPDYSMVLCNGLNTIIKEAENELRGIEIVNDDAVDKRDFLQAVIIAQKALIRFASRFADLAQNMAENEKDLVRSNELNRISEICRWVPANPARNFYEALQSFWFVFLVLNPNNILSYGRFDQLMYPFYKKDVEEKRIVEAEALELLQCLRIKDMQTITTGGKGQREKWSGLAKWHNMVIGGQTSDGQDATNELTYIILEAAKNCPTPNHTITVRVHEKTPETLMLKAIELVKTGIGMPAFVGDKSYIEFMLHHGIPIELARDYTLAGCINAALTGRSRFISDPMFIVPRVFDIFLRNGVDPHTGRQVGPQTGDLEQFESFDDLMQAWKKQLEFFMKRHTEYHNAYIRTYAELYPQPLESSLMVDGIKVGKDLLRRTFPLENAAITNAVGMVNIADSLAAIKKVVFEQKKVTLKELKAALEANWQGNNYPELQKMFLAAPKYGNDNDDVDAIARELYQFWADTTTSFKSLLGSKLIPGAISISAQWPGGEETCATPDGRYAGEVLADGTMSAMRGMDTHGPTAAIKSASKIDQDPFETTLMNMKFHPSALQRIEDMEKLSALIKTYFSLGGKHIQFNVVGKDTLLAAQKQPEQHRDLIVRVAGYSAYFVQLGDAMQEEIIRRTEHEMTA
ncbi:glycyl radical protein [Thermodesulfobacteriota bacterium]